ncbi:amino acid adenylation domain-containing protein [Streptosporangium becharense]|uniref:Amino acid adenylation domain-containing protein n=1 Tax=Streptosporangium becharense TaxID=1816182 RepID=A0A7W9MDQ5_9ACTN|nr:non-ribosomal peptide synthetase [Streptosporangium becharense]MBB2914110.1 amino acid adenylation domain-containing protein [Streptosporangium becharense]MBB5817137.1 amino acid adenylation domain-containing protein [Streptosporangium becharense]
MIDSQNSPQKCVGPIAIAPSTVSVLDGLARTAGTDDLAPFTVCAAVLADRLAAPRKVRVIRGDLEEVVPGTAGPVDPALSLRAAVARMDAGRDTTRSAEPADVTVLLSDDGLRLYVETATGAESWARTYTRLLAGAAGRPDVPLSLPSLLHRPLTRPVEEQAERTPDAVAVLDEDGLTLTYRELNEETNRIARFLIERGAGRGTRIGICLERSVDQIVAIHAAVKTGAAYVPLDADLPDARLAYMLEDAGPLHVMTDAVCRDRIPAGPWSVHDLRADRARWASQPAGNPTVEGSPADLLHILYTSGTTGLPKGVAYPSDGALTHLEWMQSRYPFRPGDTAVFKTSPGFDVSVWEIFWPFYHGGRLVVCRPGGHQDPRHLARLVEEHAVSTLFLPPTMMAPFLEEVRPAHAAALRWAFCGGEPVTPRIRDTFHTTLPQATLVNCYGPTEAGNVTDMVLPHAPGRPVPLGRPAANFRLLVLDENLEPVPAGTPGEAYIGGDPGLALAYWRAPGRTAERFVADPYGPPGSRLYRTGDLCRRRDDGVLEHLGRIDRQIKIRGLRVEPGEVEAVLAAHPAVADCAVIAHGEPLRLLAFVVPHEAELDTGAILAHAAATLPGHMVPARVVAVPRIPATVNGKIDREALLSFPSRPRDREIVPPADETEAALAEIYGRVLDVGPVSVLDTFTLLGGDSIRAFRLLEACEERFETRPAVADLLTSPLRAVAAAIRAAERSPVDGTGSGSAPKPTVSP